MKHNDEDVKNQLHSENICHLDQVPLPSSRLLRGQI